jgi:hypothetical protein
MLRNRLLNTSRILSRGLSDFGWILAFMGLGLVVALLGDPLREQNPRGATKNSVNKKQPSRDESSER